MSIGESSVGRGRVCIPGRSAEPVVSAESLVAAIRPEDVETFRPLLPVGYASVADALRAAVAELTARDLTTHYSGGLDFFRDEFTPHLRQRLADLSGGAWNLDDYVAYAAGSDVDLMTHIVEAVAARGRVALFPGDWYGFRVGATHDANIQWDASGSAELACLCIPSVRNGHVTSEMMEFLRSAKACLLNINLFPTLQAGERHAVAERLNEVLDRAVISVSFSRGFGLTASQLGVILVHRDHPWRERFERQWNWLTYFHNALAARAFMAISPEELQQVDDRRRAWVHDWLQQHDLPCASGGSYYVRSFRVEGELPSYLDPLVRDGLVRMCFKPPQT